MSRIPAVDRLFDEFVADDFVVVAHLSEKPSIS